MNIALWIVQALLGFAFLMAGGMKASQSKEKILENPQMGWANDFSDSQIKTIGILEVLGAIGIVLPWATDILPWLTPLAAFGLVLTMIGAAYTHYRRGEMQAIIPNMVLLALALFVAIGRL
ncbi:MAG TPA: DoxX family protein [Anaerolineae bacterium]|nr:DoxX family protein [Anaerolineae bacterium]